MSTLPAALRHAVRRWWQRHGVRLDVLDLEALAREPWTRPWTPQQLREAVLERLGWIIHEGDCPMGECQGYMADPTARTDDERPCETCYARWDHGDNWRGPLLVMGGVECCPACECEMESKAEACGCGHEPRGLTLERALRLSTEANDATSGM